MQGLPARGQQAVVGRFLNKGMSEEIALRRGEPAGVHQPQPLQMPETLRQLWALTYYPLDEQQGEFPADHAGRLDYPFLEFSQTIDPGHDQALDRFWNLCGREVLSEGV